MPSLKQQFADTIGELRRLGHQPAAKAVAELRERLEQLDHQRCTITDRGEHDELSKLGDQARGLLIHAYSRAEVGRSVAKAARDRQIHDVLNPTILSPQHDTVPEIEAAELEWDVLDEFER
ncbi:hypothetical protein [Nocardia suismassiliense]|uniref:hypothetical protein n=1 Tax=Nocardia suismassiliense TaxID=2077092 RepID=UPI000D1FA6DB|nr:hypothetical protein [Nocardia suismassiliense]